MIQLDQIVRTLGGRHVLDHVSLRIGSAERLGVVGCNGAGKTTLLRLLAGGDEPDEGALRRAKGLRLGHLPQEVAALGQDRILDATLDGAAQIREVERAIAAVEAELAAAPPAADEGPDEAALGRLADLHDHLSALGGYDVEARARRILAGLGFDDADCERSVAELSGGWMMRVALARLLLAEPDLLLLDEPTNHLDLPSLEWFEAFLQGFRGAIVLISHDRSFLDRTVRGIVEIDRGAVTRYAGNYSAYLKERALRVEAQERAAEGQARKIAEMERFIQRFRAKATKARQVQSRIRQLEKMERIQAPSSRKAFRGFSFPKPWRTGEIVMELQAVCAGYDGVDVLHRIDLALARGDRVALVGPNGAGKSTLLKVLAGSIRPSSGLRKVGMKVATSFFGQHQLQELDLEATALQSAQSAASGASMTQVRGALGAFLFGADDVDKKVAVLSGGEKARLALVRMLLKPAPLLILDEPTNHLDLESRKALEDALVGFAGTLVLVSHDRAFLDRLATSIVEVERGRCTRYEGNYSDYLRQRASREAALRERSAKAPPPARAGPGKAAGPGVGRALEAGKRVSQKEIRRLAAQERARRTRHLGPLQAEAGRLERAVAEAEQKLAETDAQIADPDFYANDVDGEVFRARAELAEELERLMERWVKTTEALEKAHQELARG